MKHVVDYCIIYNHDAMAMTKEVKDLMRVGWEPYGPLVVTKSPPTQLEGPQTTYVREMVKVDDNWERALFNQVATLTEALRGQNPTHPLLPENRGK